MKDAQGLYYHPSFNNQEVRMYVRQNGDKVEFRMWNIKEPVIWEKHQWVPYDAIERAAVMYKERKTGRNPLSLYDIEVAKRLIADES